MSSEAYDRPVVLDTEAAEANTDEPLESTINLEDDRMKNGQNGGDHPQQDPQQQQQQQQQPQRDQLPNLGPSNEQNRPRPAKTVFFHRDGVQHKEPVRLAIHPNRYRGLDTLLTELTGRMPELSYGVRAVFTPKGRNRVASVEDFANQGHYVCSTNQRRAGPLPGQQPLPPPPAWRVAGGKPRNGTAPDPIRPAPRRSQPDSRSYPGSEPDAAGPAPYGPTFRPADCKRIYARKNGEPFKKHIVLLNKRNVRDYEQVLDDLSAMFQMQVRRLYTVDGEPVESLSAIYNGPDHLVVAGAEKFKPMMNAWNDSPAGDGAKAGAAKSHPAPAARRVNNNNHANNSRSNASKSKGQWRIRVSTQSGTDEQGTSSRVFITVYGRQGSSEPIALSMPIQTDCIVDPFRPGQEDEFEINTGPIGEVMKVRLSLDCSGPNPDWCVGQLVMTDAHTSEQLTFDFNCCLSDSRPDCEPSKELPAVREGAKPLPMEKYIVEVCTGSCYNASTEAAVSVVIFGDYGDTGPRRLSKPTSGAQQLFQMGQTDTFELDAVYLGRIKKLVIGHDGKGAGYGWFLDSVQVTAASKPDAPVVFLCHRWLDEAEDDGKTTRELRPQDQQQQQQQQQQAELPLDPLEKLAWQSVAWIFQPDTVIQLYSRLTGQPIRINSDNTVDASAGDKDSTSFFTVGGKKDSIRTLRADTGSGLGSYLAIDGGQIIGQAKLGPHTELRVRAHQSSLGAISLESARAPLLFVGFSVDGRPVDPRQWKGAPLDGPARLLAPHCRGALREGGTVMLACSVAQALSLDHDNSVHGAGSCGPMAQFRVWRPPGEDDDDDSERPDGEDPGGSVRLFESAMFPEQFLRLKDGAIDCRGTGDATCYFRVSRQKAEGTATLESVRYPASFVGLTPEGRAAVADGGETVKPARFFIEVVTFGKPKSRPAPPQPKPQPQKQPPPKPPAQPKQAKPQPEAQQPKEQQPSEPPDTSRASLKEPHDWLLRIDTEEACVCADVSLTVYGEQKSVGPISLGSAGGAAFAAATQDEFKIELKDAEPVYKLRLELKPWLEPTEPPVWSINQLLLSRPETEIDFKIARCRLGLGEGLELAAEFPTPDSGLEVLQYTIQLATGSEQEQAFQGGVSVCLIGERGDTGRRPCYELGPMAAGDVNQFSISAVDLGQLKQCLVSAEVSKAGAGWHCDGLMVTMPTGQQAVFACGAWLDPGKSDGKTERLLRLDEISQATSKLVAEAVSAAVLELQDELSAENLTEDEDLKQYEEDEAKAKALIDDIAEQAAKRVQELHDAEGFDPPST